MAGDWIKMRTALAHDPAVIAIALDLDKSEFEVVGMLHHLWSWADSQSQDGHIKRVTEVWIDRYVHHKGFAKSMVDAGWLVIEELGITFPNFDRHNGESAKKRAEAAERQRISRENKKNGIVTDPSQVPCDKSVTREEKRREEDKDQKSLIKFDQKSAFDIFWKLYPRKVSKTPSQKKFMTKCKDADTFAKIIRSVGEHIQYAWDLSEMQFIPHASTWLNQEKWNDEVSHVRPKAGTDTGANRQGRPSLIEQVRQRGREIELERGGQAGYGSAPDGELPPAWLEEGGIDWDGEFARIDDSDGSIVGADD